jgi:YVTN family beta-propeller protein
VWVTDTVGATVSRIDSHTHAVVPIPVGEAPSGIAVGSGAVWVANSGDSTVSRIDPTSYRTLTLPVLPGPTGVVVAASHVWVTNTLGASVTRIDPRTNAVTVVRVGTNPTGIAFGKGSLWVADQGDGTVTRLNPSTLHADAVIKVGNSPAGIAVADGAAWVANNIDGSLSRIDADDQSVTSRTITAKGGAYGVASDGKNVWVSNEYAGTISQVNARRFTLVRTVRTRGAPLGLTFAGGQLWFTASAGGRALHRGGVLTIAATSLSEYGGYDPGDLDSATDFDPNLSRLLAMTNDGLVGFRRTGGVEGAQLVPDLATSLPLPTDNGLTYTFYLRTGLLYSTGQPVRPQTSASGSSGQPGTISPRPRGSRESPAA